MNLFIPNFNFMDPTPLHIEKREMISILQKHLPACNAALSIKCNDGSDLFSIESLGFKHLVGIDSEHWEHYVFYLGYQEGEAQINGNKLEKKPLNRIFKARYSFIMGDVFDHDFKGQKFDYISCPFILTDISYHSQAKALIYISELLTPKGIIYTKIFSDKSEDFSLRPGRYSRENSIVNEVRKKTYLLTEEQMDKLFIEANLEVIDAKQKYGQHRFFLKKK